MTAAKQHEPATRDNENSDLRYLDATRVQSPLGDLASVRVLGADNQRIGQIDGVLIDPAERRLRFFVVTASHSRRCYLLPTDCAASIDRRDLTLRLDVEPNDLQHCREFHRSAARDFSDEDLLTSMFGRRTA